MDIEVRQLRVLVAVDEERSFTAAADRLRMSQAAVSRSLAALEHELGARLMSSSKALAVRAMSQPWLVSGVENPNPGIDGATTWKAGVAASAAPPCPGSASSGAMPANSTKHDG